MPKEYITVTYQTKDTDTKRVFGVNQFDDAQKLYWDLMDNYPEVLSGQYQYSILDDDDEWVHARPIGAFFK